jgi:iron transport multicopper oxidase
LIGFLTVVWYGWGSLDEGELEEEVRRKIEAKKGKKSLFKRISGRV